MLHLEEGDTHGISRFILRGIRAVTWRLRRGENGRKERPGGDASGKKERSWSKKGQERERRGWR